MKKKTLAIILALCMVISLMPVTALAAPVQKQTAQIQAVPEVKDIEGLPEMPAQPASGDYKISVSVVKNSSRGEVELSASSANAQEYVYLLANPDDGYLVEFGGGYEYYNYQMEIYYIGMDTYLIVMPDGDVNLEVSFVKAGGSSHDITLNVSEGGSATLSRKSAKENESIILEVATDPGYTLSYVGGTYGSGEYATGIDLGEMDGFHYFDIYMPGADLTLTVEFTRNGPYSVTTFLDCDPEWGSVTVSPTQAYAGDTVTATITPSLGYRFGHAVAYSLEDGSSTDLTPIGRNQYTFVMPNGPVEVHVAFEAVINPVTVVVDTGLGGTAAVDAPEAQEGSTVTLTCVPEDGYRVAQITGAEVVDNGDNTYSFTMPGKAVELHVLFLRHENPFVDVNETHFFYDPVLWAVENGITYGMDDTHFGPFGYCNRAQVVTFLWRAAGSPEPVSTENPFEDVEEGVFYHKAVLWAVENGITNGMSATTFGPNEICNRAQVVTFLHRSKGSPAPATTENPFTDVHDDFYYNAVLWALENGVTTGATETTFNPNGQCMRAHVVTFLYRAAQLPPAPQAYELHWVINGFQDTPSDYGTVTLSHSSAQAGETITATVVAAEGYILDWVKCENGTEVTQVSDTEFTFVMPDHAEIFHVNFSAAATEPDPTDPVPSEPAE